VLGAVLGVRRLTGRWPHTDEASRVTEAAATVRLVRRSRVVIESEVRLARGPLDTHGVAAQRLALVTLAELGTFGLVVSVELKKRLMSDCVLLCKPLYVMIIRYSHRCETSNFT
jgi:hypothetical protein